MDFDKGDTKVRLARSENLLLLMLSLVFSHPQGYVRFDDDDGATKAFTEMEKSKNQLCGVEVKLRVLEGEEEVSYWTKLAAAAQARGKKKKQLAGRGSRRRAPKRGLRNGEKDVPATKQAKSDDDS